MSSVNEYKLQNYFETNLLLCTRSGMQMRSHQQCGKGRSYIYINCHCGNASTFGVLGERETPVRCEHFSFDEKKSFHSYLEPPIQFEHCNQKCIYVYCKAVRENEREKKDDIRTKLPSRSWKRNNEQSLASRRRAALDRSAAEWNGKFRFTHAKWDDDDFM